MSQFPEALAYLLKFEDSRLTYATTSDNRGQVIAGVNSAAFPQQFAFINSLPIDQRAQAVAGFYLSEFWKPLHLGGIESQDVANRVLDAAVNMGPGTAVKLLQSAVNRLFTSQAQSIAEDGRMGPLTLGAVNSRDADEVLAAFRAERSDYYRDLVAKNPDSAPYLKGWLARAMA